MNKIIRFSFILILAYGLVGCGAKSTPTPAQETPVAGPVAAPTETPIPPTPTTENTPEPTATPAPVVLEAEVNAATLNMRTGPSILHEILNQYQKGDTLQVIGTAPGRQWVKVLTKDNKTGWMLLAHLILKGEAYALPVLAINESLTAVGKVVDGSGKGVAGVQVALTRVGGAQAVRVDGISLEDGTVYIFAPVDYQGTWLANVIGAECTSQIVDKNCRFAGKFSPASGIPLKLPQDTEIAFTYQ
jgi:SH3-like domain-containing protein